MLTAKKCKTAAIAASALVAISITSGFARESQSLKTGAGKAPVKAATALSRLSLARLKNCTYRIPDLACGYTNVTLSDGRGEKDGVRVIFGRAAFGNLAGNKPAAVVHLAYFTPELGWLQQLAFVSEQNNKITQTAEYILDDRDDLLDLMVNNGTVLVETHSRDPYAQQMLDKLTKIRLADSGHGYMLDVTEWDKQPGGQLTAHTNLSPYLAKVEDRIGRCWTPTNKDRSEHVVVSFTIKPSGAVQDVHVSNSSEIATADQAALEAIEQAAPFPPLPGKDNEPLTVCLEFQAGVTVRQ